MILLPDCNSWVSRWNKVIRQAGVEFELSLPHVAFHRQIGLYVDLHVTPQGKMVSAEEWKASSDQWLPGNDEREYIESLMEPRWKTGEYASWIAPPKTKINRRPGSFEWVKLAD